MNYFLSRSHGVTVWSLVALQPCLTEEASTQTSITYDPFRATNAVLFPVAGCSMFDTSSSPEDDFVALFHGATDPHHKLRYWRHLTHVSSVLAPCSHPPSPMCIHSPTRAPTKLANEVEVLRGASETYWAVSQTAQLQNQRLCLSGPGMSHSTRSVAFLFILFHLRLQPPSPGGQHALHQFPASSPRKSCATFHSARSSHVQALLLWDSELQCRTKRIDQHWTALHHVRKLGHRRQSLPSALQSVGAHDAAHTPWSAPCCCEHCVAVPNQHVLQKV